MLRTGCYVKQMKSIQFFNPLSVIYMRALFNNSTIVNICWMIQTFKYQCFGFQVHFKSISVYDMKTKSDFWSKYPHYILGYIINCGLYVFPIFIGFGFGIYRLFIVPNLECIHAVFAMLWSVAKLFWWVYIGSQTKLGPRGWALSWPLGVPRGKWPSQCAYSAKGLSYIYIYIESRK